MNYSMHNCEVPTAQFGQMYSEIYSATDALIIYSLFISCCYNCWDCSICAHRRFHSLFCLVSKEKGNEFM